ncbi:D-hexose-6-phosphate mutarotase [Ornithinimicrobium pratense]|uniref:Putative glucose-6-phosphate 1-epimerase n=1 Tax=Ornithinimicrobium pratense TaxID=2593973 RepID=A0A5J6V682_9MICO|nr:D-hexose-6-phosphate mutarotase [Ornithinimicrobium pratense]QFG68636.1 D-hexose-6-phosphate mutarotase [Ornithinimicrobium pratense]
MSLTPRVHDDGRSRLMAYDHGAHLATWELDGEPVLWLSEAAVLDGSHAIRGGVPICFPWFADGPDGEHSPSHGVVRTAVWRPATAQGEEIWAWELSHTDVVSAPGADQIPGPFHLRYAVRLSPSGAGRPVLHLELQAHNPGPSTYEVEVALHTYVAVGDVEQVQIEGLDTADYLDKVTGSRRRQEGPVRLTGETDRVYERSGPVRVQDHAGGRAVELSPRGAAQTVVWNPWAEQAATTSDLTDESWRRFVCVETAATKEQALTVTPGQTRTLGCSLSTHPVGR